MCFCYIISYVFLYQVIHNLSMWSATDKVMSYDKVKSDAAKAKKDIKLVKLLFTGTYLYLICIFTFLCINIQVSRALPFTLVSLSNEYMS